jgi:hypothetical protein
MVQLELNLWVFAVVSGCRGGSTRRPRLRPKYLVGRRGPYVAIARPAQRAPDFRAQGPSQDQVTDRSTHKLHSRCSWAARASAET